MSLYTCPPSAAWAAAAAAAATAALAASTEGSAGAGGGGGDPSASVFKLDILKLFMVGTGILKVWKFCKFIKKKTNGQNPFCPVFAFFW